MINLLAKFAPSDFLRFLDVFSDMRRRFGGRALSVNPDDAGRVAIALQFDSLAMFEAFLAEPEVAGILRAAREMNGYQLIPQSDDRKAA